MQVTPLHPLFAAELTGADLAVEPAEELVATVEAAMARYGVLVVRDARIGDEEHKRFSRAFGPLELPSRAPGGARSQGRRRFDPALFYAGNLDRDGEIIPYGSEGYKLAQGAERFHTDSSFHAMPTKWSLLLGHETPPPEAGGDTLFADTRAAWDALPEELKQRIAGLAGVHDFWEGRRRAGLTGEITPQMRRMIPFGPVAHPLVRTMPCGRGALFVPTAYCLPHHSTAPRPCASRKALALLNGFEPKNPPCAESGLGCGEVSTRWRVPGPSSGTLEALLRA